MCDTSGTPGYMAPEVLMREPQGTAVDYYALGIVTHEIMLGCRPYAGDTRESYMKAVVAEQFFLTKAQAPDGWTNESLDFINKCVKRKVN